MGFIPSWLAQIIGDSQFDATVERAVRNVELAVWDQVAITGATLSSFQLRGYLRARSALVIRRQVQLELGRGVSPKYQSRLLETVREAVIRQLIGRLAVARATVEQPQRIAA